MQLERAPALAVSLEMLSTATLAFHVRREAMHHLERQHVRFVLVLESTVGAGRPSAVRLRQDINRTEIALMSSPVTPTHLALVGATLVEIVMVATATLVVPLASRLPRDTSSMAQTIFLVWRGSSQRVERHQKLVALSATTGSILRQELLTAAR